MSTRLRAYLSSGGAVVVVAFVVYAWLAPSFIIDSDNAELATLGTVGGVPHPPGYPLYMLWLRAMSWLPGTPAHAAALATAILGAATLGVLHAACRAWGVRAGAATIAVAVFGAAPLVLRYSSEAEVFALNGLVVATILWLSARGAPLSGTARVAVLAIVAGTGLSNHTTCVLVAPIGILGIVRGIRESSHRGRAVAAGVSALVIGLIPYAYLVATGECSISWAPIHDLDALVGHSLRGDYGGPASFSPAGGNVEIGANLVALVATLGRTWLWLPLAGGVAALGYRIARPGDLESRWALVLLALSIVLAGPILIGRFDIAPRGVGLYIVQRFHLLPALLLTIPVAVAFDLAGKRVADRPLVVTAASWIAFVGLAAATGASWQSPAYDRAMRGLVRSMPPDAVIIGNGDTLYYGLGYVQDALGERPDVTYVQASATRHAWYRDRLHLDAETIPALADDVLSHGRPLFVTISMDDIIKDRPVYPYGLVLRVLPRTAQTPSVSEVFEINTKLF
ncbi:MAG TPA: DUF2723 domain-containing protein, partial [Kofleriaceae bacterium]|nr:DUF2723 domain-containing protein [Kofleriaceae bacterium]